MLETRTKRLEILENSLTKKEAELAQRINTHLDDVKKANGQPLNDKRNGRATLDRWDEQRRMIRKTEESIEKTKRAIDKEKNKIARVELFTVPAAIQELLDAGVLTQWRKYPNRFFVKGVEKARIVYENGKIFAAHHTEIPNQEQYAIFRDICKSLARKIEQEVK